MKAMAYLIMLTFLVLGVFGLLYVILDYVFDTNIYPWGEANIIDTNQTLYQTYYKLGWEALPVIVTFGAVMFLVVWAQKRGLDEYG